MKRFFFSLIALSAAVVGCTQSALLESPEIFNQEVSFSPYTGRTPVTKATDIVGKTGLASAGGFQVYCFLDKKNSSPPGSQKKKRIKITKRIKKNQKRRQRRNCPGNRRTKLSSTTSLRSVRIIRMLYTGEILRQMPFRSKA